MPAVHDAKSVADAIRAHFAHRRDEKARAVRFLMREGRQALAIGIGFLFLCGVAGTLALRALPAPLGSFVDQGLLIVGWVANWRPIEIFLYDWRPLRKEQGLFDALSRMEIAIQEGQPATHDVSDSADPMPLYGG
jgi:hypothetical protein